MAGRFDILKNKPEEPAKQPDPRLFKKIDLNKTRGFPFCMTWLFPPRREPLICTGSLDVIERWSQQTNIPLCHGVTNTYHYGKIVSHYWNLFGNVAFRGSEFRLSHHRRSRIMGVTRSIYSLVWGNYLIRTYRKLPRSPLLIFERVQRGNLESDPSTWGLAAGQRTISRGVMPNLTRSGQRIRSDVLLPDTNGVADIFRRDVDRLFGNNSPGEDLPF